MSTASFAESFGRTILCTEIFVVTILCVLLPRSFQVLQWYCVRTEIFIAIWNWYIQFSTLFQDWGISICIQMPFICQQYKGFHFDLVQNPYSVISILHCGIHSRIRLTIICFEITLVYYIWIWQALSWPSLVPLGNENPTIPGHNSGSPTSISNLSKHAPLLLPPP